jgi:hypothetical protein
MKKQIACIVSAALLLSLTVCGCDVFGVFFSSSTDEAISVSANVLSVFTDTMPFVTEDDVTFDQQSNLLSYRSDDASFQFQYDFSSGDGSYTFDGYRPSYSDYAITGTLDTVSVIWPPDISFETSGTLELTGGAVSTLQLDIKLKRNTDADTTDLSGNIRANGREFDNIVEWNLASAAFADIELMLGLRDIPVY